MNQIVIKEFGVTTVTDEVAIYMEQQQVKYRRVEKFQTHRGITIVSAIQK